mmetsp:Transcript_13993/g.33337  ORF Transcript_13993/g.33337 Transcript_13993/m.33337 type:complete len:133 (-) Transcript_13993:273-671(-)
MSVFSTVKASLFELDPLIPAGWISQYHDGEWTAETPGDRKINKNPQYCVTTPENVSAVILLESHMARQVAVALVSTHCTQPLGDDAFTQNYNVQIDVTFKAGENRLVVASLSSDEGKYRLSIHTAPVSGTPV